MSIVHEHLWRTVFDVSNQVLFSLVTREPLSRAEELRSPKVAYSNVAIITNEHVIRFDVVVDDAQ